MLTENIILGWYQGYVPCLAMRGSQLAHDVWCKLWKSCEPVVKPGKKYRCGGRSGGIGTRRGRLSRWRREAASCSVQDMHVFHVSVCPGTEASS